MLEQAQEQAKLSRKILSIQSCSDSVHTIQREVAKYFGLEASDLTGPFRARKYSVPRHIAIWLCRQMVKCENGNQISLPVLGNLFGGRDHSTVLIALRRIQSQIEEGGEVAKTVLALSDVVREKTGGGQ